MRRIFLKILCALGPALLADSGTQAQNLIVNGDFEAPILADGTYQMLSEIPGWRVVSGPGLDLCRLGWEVDGKQMVELDSSANSGIRQVVPTIPGKRYELSVFYAPRWGSQFPPQTSVVHVFSTADCCSLSQGAHQLFLTDGISGQLLLVQYKARLYFGLEELATVMGDG